MIMVTLPIHTKKDGLFKSSVETVVRLLRMEDGGLYNDTTIMKVSSRRKVI
jgi:hypothetical protein